MKARPNFLAASGFGQLVVSRKSHGGGEFGGLEHAHLVAVAVGPDVGEAVERRNGSQRTVEALEAACAVAAIVDHDEWRFATQRFDGTVGALDRRGCSTRNIYVRERPR